MTETYTTPTPEIPESGKASASSASDTTGKPDPAQVYADIDRIIKRYVLVRRLYMAARVVGIIVALFFIALSALNLINVFIGMMIPFFIVWFVFAAPQQPPFDFGVLNVLLTQRCDPYAYAQAFYRLMPLFKKKSNDYNICLINISLGTLLQGQLDTMKSYITMTDVNDMNPEMFYAYYDIWARYYFAKGDLTRLDLAESYVHQIIDDYPDLNIRPVCERTLENITVYRAVLTKQPDDGYPAMEKRNYFLHANAGSVTPFLEVEYYYLHALLDELKEDYLAMQEHCVYVIHNGNTLDWVQQASTMLKRAPSVTA